MQLFITDEFQVKNNEIIVSEKRIVDQLRKVLRAKAWYTFFLQNKTDKNWIITRYKVETTKITDKVEWKILQKEENSLENIEKKWVITAILNKFDKMELIVQKLTEIWIYYIYFVATARSVFKDIKEKKLERFYKIALEAAEQSRSWFFPEIKILKSLDEIPSQTAILDFDWKNYKQAELWETTYILVGPEGGFDKKDYEKLDQVEKLSLGDKVLRAETASIIWWFILK